VKSSDKPLVTAVAIVALALLPFALSWLLSAVGVR